MAKETTVSPSVGEQAADRAAGNAAIRAVAEIVAKLASLGLIFVLARQVGPAGLGVFVFAMAWSELSNLPVDMGFDRYLSRQIAEDRRNIELLTLNVLVTKLRRAVPVLVISVVLVNLLGYSDVQRSAVYVAVVAVIFDSFSKTIQAIFVGLEFGGLASAVLLAQRVLAAALGLLALLLGYGVVAVLAAYGVSTLLAFGLSLVLLRRRLGRLQLVVSPEGRRQIRRRTAGLAAHEVFASGIARADVVLLSLLGTTVAVGQYGAGYRLIEATLFLPLAVTTAFTAMFTYLDDESTPTIQAAYAYALKGTMTLLTPFSVVFLLMPGPLLELLFGDGFGDAVGPLRLLAGVVALLGVVLISTSLVISRRPASLALRAIGVALAINLVANVALIGPFGASGAATAMLMTEGVLAIIMYELASRTIGRPALSRIFAGPAVGAILMAICLIALVSLPLVAIIVGGVAYAAGSAITERLLHPGDLEVVRGILRRRLGGRLGRERA